MAEHLSRKTLYLQVADILRKEVAGHQPGDRLESESALSKRFSVSLSTIRDALMQLTAEGTVERYHGRGTFVGEQTDSAEQEKEKHIAVLIDKDISHPQLSYAHIRVSETLLHLFKQRGLSVQRYTGRKKPWEIDGEPTCEEFLNAVKEDQIKAVVQVAGYSHPSWVDSLRQRDIPMVGVWGDGMAYVTPDYPQMLRGAVDYLYEHGRKKIGLMEWYDEQAVMRQGKQIFGAFSKQMELRGLPVHKKWIRRDLPAPDAGAGWADFREIWAASDEKPDGLVITDDILFRDATSAILQLGIQVPDDLMLITHANKGSKIFTPLQVVQVQIDPDDIARGLFEITVRRLEGKPDDDISRKVNFTWIEPESYKQSFNTPNKEDALCIA